MRIIGEPVVETLIREDGQPVEPRFPKHIVRRAEWYKWLDEEQEDIRLIDWGESFGRGEEPSQVALPIDCKAPETIFTDRLDYRIDLWTAGIVVGCPVILPCCLYTHRPADISYDIRTQAIRRI